MVVADSVLLLLLQVVVVDVLRVVVDVVVVVVLRVFRLLAFCCPSWLYRVLLGFSITDESANGSTNENPRWIDR